MRPQNPLFSLVQSQNNVIDSANPGGAFDDGVENRLHVRRRAADYAEDFRCRRLMFQRLAQLCVTRAKFLEQANVLDGDDGLVGEGLEKRNLFVGKGSHFSTANQNR